MKGKQVRKTKAELIQRMVGIQKSTKSEAK